MRIESSMTMYSKFVYGGGMMPDWQAGSCVDKYNAESPKQDSKRFNSITKTIHFAHLVILFIYGGLTLFLLQPRAR